MIFGIFYFFVLKKLVFASIQLLEKYFKLFEPCFEGSIRMRVVILKLRRLIHSKVPNGTFEIDIPEVSYNET